MAWNEPGGGNNKDPWGSGGNKNQGPPDLDEALRKLQEKLSGIFGGKPSGNGGGSSPSISGGFLAALAGIAVIIWALFGIYQVNEQERAVVLRFGLYHSVVQPGLHWNPPLIDDVIIENTTRLRLYSTKGRMLTEDLNIIEVELSVQYSIDDIKLFLLAVVNPERSLEQAADSALRHVVGSSIMNSVLTEGRSQVAIEVQRRLQDYLDSYRTGIRLTTVNIEKTSPPPEVQDAFDDVNKAREDEERYRNQAETYANGIIPEARGKAKRVLEEASAYHDQVIARAEGEAQRFENLLAEYKKAPRVTRERLYLDAVQEVMTNGSKILVDVEGGNNMMYLPLDKIMQSTAGASSAIGSSGGGQSISSDSIREISEQVVSQLRREASTNSRRRETR
ncbi:FtsH protease activity modulator HflK [Dasania sp. GY-MA-18]|uniref:Protein HflK n=1 Tax=Dasania phycosphaerae TaxID=2950436 RepID=A0A9J6RM11_9GAMM|nr:MULTISPECIES: FtsH protease activity modulator HflK [Dasania]MCR8923123.1 FtsH protease activity modulator HflK [Dasania sp. GY-MA-18]MCZ0865555.1 FtsH protease activity modulator HflK [Dasania phycosphaerae]MCZ0869280.1 FtsH protease activity modulator HflK [Dasania phycosphaerae]